MSAFFIYDSGPYNFSPIRPLCRIEILTKFVSPPHCHATWCLYFSESDVFQIYAPSLFSLDKRFFKVKPFRMTLYREGCILILGKRFFLLTVVKITTVLFWAYTKNLLKNIRLVWDSSGLHPSEWHTSRQGIFHCSNDVYFKGGSLLSFRMNMRNPMLFVWDSSFHCVPFRMTAMSSRT